MGRLKNTKPHKGAPEAAATNGVPRSKISVVVAASSPLLLRGITNILGTDSNISLAAGVATGAEALDAIRHYEPDVAILSLHLPDMGGLDAVSNLAGEPLRTRSVILASQLNQVDFLRAMRLGVHGIVFEEMPANVLVRCVQLVCAGGDFLDRDLVLAAFGKAAREEGVETEVSRLLTAREHAVVEQAVSGLRNKEIARRLGLTEGTVKSHLHRAYFKLQIRSRYALIKRTGGTDLIPPTTRSARGS